MYRLPYPVGQLGQPEPQQDEPQALSSAQLATSMVLRGAVGTVVGAAVAPRGREGLWAAVGFAMGATVGEVGIVGIALGALWRKAD